ncbi:hypothetical protein GCM10023193_58340 [Planotetraspora kaengkrachanensis]|uniref:Uncharacterized protein n=1 Tax=Planotetraspora kaengkrachanensis TaxID=575193 RepID=A0A8J3PV37_9ACTN|nr:hypothetical protein Pka01_47460 [Planotetraspora kaengkrachanensis]
MTLPKKGSRLITVSDTTYRWRVRHKPTYCEGVGWSPLTFAVELAEGPYNVLLVTLPYARPDNWVLEQSMLRDRGDGVTHLVAQAVSPVAGPRGRTSSEPGRFGSSSRRVLTIDNVHT